MNQLAAHKLSCGYGSRMVFEDWSLALQPGEVFVLLGPNGSGKSTLLRALARQRQPQSGQVLLDERDVWSQGPEAVARQIALMPQNERRDWPLNVEDAVLLGRIPHRGWLASFTADDLQALETALQATGLMTLRTRAITELSGGEWRRMVFARALAQKASIILLDEPTAGLDIKYQHEVLRTARDLAHRSQLSVAVTLHDLNLAALYGDRLALISNGAPLLIGPPEVILTPERIQHAFGIESRVIPHPVYGTPLVVPMLG